MTRRLQIITRDRANMMIDFSSQTGVRYLLSLNWPAGLDFQIQQVCLLAEIGSCVLYELFILSGQAIAIYSLLPPNLIVGIDLANEPDVYGTVRRISDTESKFMDELRTCTLHLHGCFLFLDYFYWYDTPGEQMID